MTTRSPPSQRTTSTKASDRRCAWRRSVVLYCCLPPRLCAHAPRPPHPPGHAGEYLPASHRHRRRAQSVRRWQEWHTAGGEVPGSCAPEGPVQCTTVQRGPVPGHQGRQRERFHSVIDSAVRCQGTKGGNASVSTALLTARSGARAPWAATRAFPQRVVLIHGRESPTCDR